MRRPETSAWATTSAVTCGGLGGLTCPADRSRLVPSAATPFPGPARRRGPTPLTGPPWLPYKESDALVTIGTSGPGLPPAPLAVPGPRRSLSATIVRPRPVLVRPEVVRPSAPPPGPARRRGRGCLATPGLAQEQKEVAYRAFPVVGSRLIVWVVAQLHLNFAAFILGVPIFAVIIEIMGWRRGMDTEEGRRYDWLSHEFVKLTFAAFSTTALLGRPPAVPPDHALPAVLDVHDGDLRPDHVGLRRSCSSSRPSPSTSGTTAGTGSRGRARASTWRSASSPTSSAPRSCSWRTPGSRS